MNNLIKWPFSNDKFPNVKSLLDDFWLDTPEFFNRMLSTGTTLPAANIKETDSAYQIDLAVPGLKKEDLKISLDHHRLVVSAEQKEEKEAKEKQYSRREYSFSSFKRSFMLPEDANTEAVTATYTDGILQLTAPKLAVTPPKEAREIGIQ